MYEQSQMKWANTCTSIATQINISGRQKSELYRERNDNKRF